MGVSISGTPGLHNCNLSYGVKDNYFSFNTRCRALGHGFDVVATESHAREHRAMYPHQRAEAPFTIMFELKGYVEFQKLIAYFQGYIKSFMVAARNAMLVAVPSRNFQRVGVPIGGLPNGDHVGSNVFTPTVQFQSILDPLDKTIFTGPDGTISQYYSNGSSADPAARFFYPTTVSTSDPNATEAGLYDSAPFTLGQDVGAIVGNLVGPR